MPSSAWSSDVCSRSEEHTSELQSLTNLVCRLLLDKKDEPLSKGLFAGKQLQHGIGNGFYPQTGAFGKFSNLMIFKRTLSSKEIRQLHQVPSFLASRNALHQENRKYRFNAILVSITLGTCSAMVLFIKLFS